MDFLFAEFVAFHTHFQIIQLFVITKVVPETGYVVLFEECSEGSLYFICQGAVLQRRLVRIRRDKILLYSKLDWSRL